MHCKSYSHFISKKFRHICVSLDVNFNESLTNDVVSFEQLGPPFYQSFIVVKTDKNQSFAPVLSSAVTILGYQFAFIVILSCIYIHQTRKKALPSHTILSTNSDLFLCLSTDLFYIDIFVSLFVLNFHLSF